jgi:hypothetical protein
MAKKRREEVVPEAVPVLVIPPEHGPIRPPELKRAAGSPALGLLSDPRIPWRTLEGASATLELVLTNRGGPLKGAYVEVAGAGFTQDKLVTPSNAAVQGQPKSAAPFVLKGGVARAELPQLALDAGYVEPTGKKKTDFPLPPPPSLRLTVSMRGDKAGSALVTVRVGCLDANEPRGSALQGKSFVVERAS